MNYTFFTSPAVKRTVSISRRDLWINYVNAWRDMTLDQVGVSTSDLDRVAKILLTDGDLNILALRRQFRSGETFLFMGDAMDVLDQSDDHKARNVLREVIVVDGDKQFVIPHEDINY